MTDSNLQKSITQFLDATNGAREVSLIVIDKQEDQDEFIRLLHDYNFKQCDPNSILRSLDSEKSFVLLPRDFNKELYDFIVQYPSGQIQYLDNKSFQTKIVDIDYKGRSCILITTNDTLQAWADAGFLVRNKVGLVYTKTPGALLPG